MRDRVKIAGGLALFLSLALFPVWQRAASGRAPRPEPKIAKPQTKCVAPGAVMRVSHMQLLDGWRDGVVRRAARTARAADGRLLDVSLTGTCLECHPNKKEFCDACHTDLAVKPVCFDCHSEPKERV
jgi:hypothetical protein